jgi:DNA-binding response OmpR family regulator
MQPRDPVITSAPKPPTTVLLVDDRKGNLLAMEAVLEPLHLRLATASSGREALKFLINQGNEGCALILLDVQMPGLDGFETAALIRQRERNRNTPIIFVTAIAREEANILKGYANGAVDYIVKPFNPDILLAKVRAFVEQHEGHKLDRTSADLKLAEATQREHLRTRQRDDMELLSETIPQQAWIADPEGAIYWFNQRWYEYTGSTVAQATG